MEATAVPPATDAAPATTRRQRSIGVLNTPLFWRLLIVGGFLAFWQWVPQIPGIRNYIVWADPFFISSPARCARMVARLFTGAGNTPTIYEPLARTIGMAMGGGLCGAIVGGSGGLLFSHMEKLNRVGRPLLTLMNAIPKITIIPIIVLVFSSSVIASFIVSFLIVFFIIFFNAYEGGQSVPKETLQLASLLGARPLTLMFRIRGPFAFAWSVGQIPNAVANGLTGTVTSELFLGSRGIGGFLITALNTQHADLTFAVVFVLAVVGVTLVFLMDIVKRRILHWW